MSVVNPLIIDFSVQAADAEHPIIVGFNIGIEADLPITLGFNLSNEIRPVTLETYDGPYDITPSDEQQVFSTEGKRLVQNFTIEPIPSNYGKITWNGSVITVS